MINNFKIKENNLYYKKFKINQGQLSWVLVPLGIIFIFMNIFLKYYSYALISIGIIGAIDCFNLLKIYKYYIFFSLAIFFHLLLLYPLINFKKNIKLNLTNLLLLLIGIIIIIILPYWPYTITKTKMILYVIFAYLFLYFFEKIIRH